MTMTHCGGFCCTRKTQMLYYCHSDILRYVPPPISIYLYTTCPPLVVIWILVKYFCECSVIRRDFITISCGVFIIGRVDVSQAGRRTCLWLLNLNVINIWLLAPYIHLKMDFADRCLMDLCVCSGVDGCRCSLAELPIHCST